MYTHTHTHLHICFWHKRKILNESSKIPVRLQTHIEIPKSKPNKSFFESRCQKICVSFFSFQSPMWKLVYRYRHSAEENRLNIYNIKTAIIFIDSSDMGENVFINISGLLFNLLKYDPNRAASEQHQRVFVVAGQFTKHIDNLLCVCVYVKKQYRSWRRQTHKKVNPIELNCGRITEIHAKNGIGRGPFSLNKWINGIRVT